MDDYEKLNEELEYYKKYNKTKIEYIGKVCHWCCEQIDERFGATIVANVAVHLACAEQILY